MEIPDDGWTGRVLLYWDSVATIVPPQALLTPELILSDHHRRLILSGLVTQLPVASLDAIPYRVVIDASRTFQSYLRTLPTEILNERRARFARARKAEFSDASNAMWIYSVKATYEMVAHLKALRLSEAYGRRSPVEIATAKDYLAVLACTFARVLSASPGDRWVVGTTEEHDLLALLQPAEAGEVAQTRLRAEAAVGQLRRVLLSALLPVPESGMDVDWILDFRRRHGDRLPAFRRFVEAQLDSLGQLQTQEQRQRVFDNLERVCEEKAQEAEELLRTSGIRRLRRSSVVALAKKLPVVGSTIEAGDAAIPILAGDARELTTPLAYAIMYRAALGRHRRKSVEVTERSSP